MTTLKERICEELENGAYYLEKDEEYYVYKLEADYNDSISMKDCWKICQKEHPMEYFDEWMFESYEYGMQMIIDSIEGQVIKALYDEEKISGDEEEEAIDIMDELIIVELPYDHFLNQEVYIDLYLDTGDGNYDFVLNNIAPAYDGQDLKTEIPEESSLRWLAETQGYTEKEMREAFMHYHEDGIPKKGFLPSVYRELGSVVSHMNTVTILAKMSFEELLQLNEKIIESTTSNSVHVYEVEERKDNGTIHISKDAEIGLFDTWNGGGGLLDIKLEKDIDLPIKYIWQAKPDITELHQWSVEDVYGVDRSIWRKVVSGIPE